MTGAADPDVRGAVQHLFRHEYGRLVAALTRVLGSGRLDVAEDVVQDALVRAMRAWPLTGVPAQPVAWLARVARNRAFDLLRRGRVEAQVAEALGRTANADLGGDAVAPVDDSLRLFFLCCHPALGHDAAITLTLKTLGGFGVPEIARALLQKEATVAQRLSRSKERMRGLPFEIPPGEALAPRLAIVLDVLYLMFNEGYSATAGAELVRVDLLQEAIRLAGLLLQDPRTATPAVHALLALMLYQASRLPARISGEGELLTLAQQDRAQWDQALIARGMQHFDWSIGGDEITPFHVEAAIASVHAAAPSYAATDWELILARYDQLVALTGSPIARLNRAVVVAILRGPDAALAELASLASAPGLAAYHLLPSVRGSFEWRAGRRDAALASFREALALAGNAPERALLERRIRDCAAGAEPPAL